MKIEITDDQKSFIVESIAQNISLWKNIQKETEENFIEEFNGTEEFDLDDVKQHIEDLEKTSIDVFNIGCL